MVGVLDARPSGNEQSRAILFSAIFRRKVRSTSAATIWAMNSRNIKASMRVFFFNQVGATSSGVSTFLHPFAPSELPDFLAVESEEVGLSPCLRPLEAGVGIPEEDLHPFDLTCSRAHIPRQSRGL
jgi:hypothetical protein